MKTIQEKLCDRVYELLPEKKSVFLGVEDNFEPIRLADVLMAVDICGQDTGVKCDGSNFTVDTKGWVRLFDSVFSRNTGNVIPQYNLMQDNLLDQSNDFCEFVYNLIK